MKLIYPANQSRTSLIVALSFAIHDAEQAVEEAQAIRNDCIKRYEDWLKLSSIKRWFMLVHPDKWAGNWLLKDSDALLGKLRQIELMAKITDADLELNEDEAKLLLGHPRD